MISDSLNKIKFYLICSITLDSSTNINYWFKTNKKLMNTQKTKKERTKERKNKDKNAFVVFCDNHESFLYIMLIIFNHILIKIFYVI